ncbi:uncharacterized protein TNCV_1222191 [Trichonephila clavipes]|nr:uncharacterized protein TNCV_1222191 [Trichonephila clavipes]
MSKDEVGMCVGCLMLMIAGEIEEIRKFCEDRVTVEMIIGVITRRAVKEISVSTSGIDFRRIIDLTIGGYQFRNGAQNDDFSRGDRRNRGSSENFSRGDRRQRGRLNVLKVSDDQNDQTPSANEVPIKLSVIRMSPVELPYVPILLNDTFTKAFWDTLEWRKYPCILGVDFISGSNIILDFDRKSLAIPDSQIDIVVKTIEEGNVEIDQSKTRLEEKQKQELRDLFNSFKGLFSDKVGLTHVLYHEIDTGDKPPVVSRPYRYDRVKQVILDYHVEKMLTEGTIIPIQSPYASLVLCRKIMGYRRIIRKCTDLLSTIGNLILLQNINVIPYP